MLNMALVCETGLYRVSRTFASTPQGMFATPEEALASGRVLVRVSIPRARGLASIAAAVAASSVSGQGSGQSRDEQVNLFMIRLNGILGFGTH